MLDPVFRAVTRFTTQRRRLVVLLLILFTALAVRWWPYFQFQPDVSKMLPVENDVVRLSELLEEQTANGRMLLIDVRAEGLDDRRLRSLVRRLEGGDARSLFDEHNERLGRGEPANFEELCVANPEHADELRRFREFEPSIEEVHATREDFVGDNWPLIHEAPLSFMPIEGLESLADRLTGSGRDEALAERRRTVASKSAFGFAEYFMDPLGVSDLLQEQVTASIPLELRPGSPFFVTADGTRAILRVKGRLDSMDVDFSRVLLEEITGALEEEVPEGSWEFYGEYARSQENLSRIRRDLRKSLVLSAILVTVFLMLSMRRLVEPLLVFVPVMLAVCWTLPYGGFFLGPLTPLTISAAALLIGLGADFSIHWLVRYGYERRDRPHAAAVGRTMSTLGKPLLASVLTSVVAFLALSRAEFTGLRNFGLLLAIGLLLAFVAAVLCMPLLTSLRRVSRSTHELRWIPWMDRFTRSASGRITAAVLLVLTGAGFTLTVVRGVEFESDLHFVRPAEDAFTDVGTRFEEEMGFAITPAVVLFDERWSPSEIGARLQALVDDGPVRFTEGPHLAHPTPARREAIERFHERTEGWVDGVLDELEKSGYGSSLPLISPGLNQFAELFEVELDDWKSEAVIHDGETYQRVLCFPRRAIDREEDWASFRAALAAAVGTDGVIAFHPQATLDEVCRILIKDLVRAALVTVLLGGLVVTVLSGGLKAGLFAMLPTAAGFGLTMGTLSLFGISLNMGNCVAIPLLLGIGVDHGVHLVAHFKQTGSTKLGSCGMAIWRSSATSIFGFGALMVADAVGIASMGWISILGVVSCLVTSLIVLPVLWPTPAPESTEVSERS